MHALLRFQSAGEMALGKVRQFVSHHRGIFGFGLGINEQAPVDTNDPAWSGEGIQLRAVQQDEFKATILQLTGFCQAIDTAFYIVLELWVRELAYLPAQQAEPCPAELVLLFR